MFESKLDKSRKKMTEVEDIMTENQDLQQTMIQKDKVIEDLEQRLERTATEAEVKLMRTVEKMRIEYQLMARSAVTAKMRKMNDFLTERLREQETVDTDKENITRAIHTDLEERLSDTTNELNQVKRRLKSMLGLYVYILIRRNISESEKELMSVKNQLDIKEKMLRSEESLRKKLEFQMNKLTNSKICDR